jgi:hypothetical protein
MFIKKVSRVFELFFARLASKFEKSTNMTFKKKFEKNKKMCQKTQNFTLILNPLRMFVKIF